jgi:hypothetical protein
LLAIASAKDEVFGFALVVAETKKFSRCFGRESLSYQPLYTLVQNRLGILKAILGNL